MSLKNCRECNAQVSSEAKTCPSCGIKRPIKRPRIVLWVGFGLFGLFTLRVCGGMLKPPSPSTSAASVAATEQQAKPAEAPPALEVDARKLWADYHANEVAADNSYKGKLLAVTGVVHSIEKDALGKIYVEFSAPNPFMATKARLRPSEAEAAAALQKGQRISVLCFGRGMLVGSPILGDCAIER